MYTERLFIAIVGAILVCQIPQSEAKSLSQIMRNRRSTRCQAETDFCSYVVNDHVHNWDNFVHKLLADYRVRRSPKPIWQRPASGLLIYDTDTTCFNAMNKVDQVWVHQCEQADMLPWVARIVQDEEGRADSMRSDFITLQTLVNNTVKQLDTHITPMTACESYSDNDGCTIDEMVETPSSCVWDNSIAEERDVDFYTSVLESLESSGSRMQQSFQRFRLPNGTC
ncbi:uncharacterized protein [Ptychodera flava]|uniref:uncharacterized protein n=1 Tax=Ptychodera flava TaxID=63121 RepID=UPI00396A6B3C